MSGWADVGSTGAAGIIGGMGVGGGGGGLLGPGLGVTLAGNDPGLLLGGAGVLHTAWGHGWEATGGAAQRLCHRSAG